MPRVACFNSFSQEFENIQIVDMPMPVPLPLTVIIKVAYASGNMIDCMIYRGYTTKFGWKIPFPYILGYDMAGKIVATGEGVHSFTVGERVQACNWGHKRPDDPFIARGGGAFAQYAMVHISKVVRLPYTLSYSVGAAMPLVSLTAYQVLTGPLDLQPGQKILILGGSTSVGLMAIQLARNIGATVYTTCSRRSMMAVASTNPHKIFDYMLLPWEKNMAFRDLDCIFDCVGEKGTIQKAKTLIKPGGAFVSVASHEVGFSPSAHPPLRHAAYYQVSQNAQQQDLMIQFVEDGKLDVYIDEEFDFNKVGVVSLMQKIAMGKSIGKNLLKIGGENLGDNESTCDVCSLM